MAETNRPTGQSYEIRVVGARREIFRDLYHRFLWLPWWAALLEIVLVDLAVNALFAVPFTFVGGVANARPGSWIDAFWFSVQTLHTIGYGAMYPASTGAHLLVTLEGATGLVLTALATGLVFAKFAQARGRIGFAHEAAIAPMDGVPTLMVRVGNERGNYVVEAQVRLVLTKTIKTAEGVTFYRMLDLALVRERTAALTRSWTVMHPIDASSPLRGMTPESLAASDGEILVSVTGTDDTSMQLVHARRTYEHTAIRWGARHADVLSEDPDGHMTLDVRRFHEMIATEPTEDFPYPKAHHE